MNGNINVSSSFGSGIGRGHNSSNGNSTVWNVRILNGNISASDSHDSGIGGGHRSSNRSSIIWNVTILNGSIKANSSSGSGTESGHGMAGGRSVVGTISLLGGTIRVISKLSGIRSGGEGGEVKLLAFTGNVHLICNVKSFTKFSVNASSIIFSNASILFETQRDQLFGAPPRSLNSLDLTIEYENMTSRNIESLWGLAGTFLQIEIFESSTIWRLDVLCWRCGL
jgi:hypothetical protein